MNKWYQTIIVNHREEDGKTIHLLDDENYKILCEERVEQLKEIERLHSIIKEVREYIKERTEFGEYTYAYPGVLNQDEVREINRILDKENK